MRNRICRLVSALHPWTTTLAFLVAGIGLAPHTPLADAPPNNPRIVNGVVTSDFPSTGALLRNRGDPATPLNASAWCSDILIGCETFLTAAYCVFNDPSPPIASYASSVPVYFCHFYCHSPLEFRAWQKPHAISRSVVAA